MAARSLPAHRRAWPASGSQPAICRGGGEGLDSSHGGAFEIVTLLTGELKKVGDVAHHFWEARNTPDGQMTITFHVSLKIEYFEAYLVIRKFEFGGEVANTITINERYIIRPVHR
jgi:hypothetical protein